MSEKNHTEGIECSHCENLAPMLIGATYSQVKTQYNDFGYNEYECGNVWHILECPSCKEVMLRRDFWHSEFDTSEDTKILYPTERINPKGLPENIEAAYEAAQRVKLVDSNAFAVLLGRVIDLVCIDKNASGRSLATKLDKLAGEGIVPARLAEMAHQLRNLRNIGAHAEMGELTTSEIPILESLINAILEYVYSAPMLVQQVKEKVDALKNKT